MACRTGRILLLDEPFQGVDAGARADIADILRANAAGRVTLIFVSAIEEAFEVAGPGPAFDRSTIETLPIKLPKLSTYEIQLNSA